MTLGTHVIFCAYGFWLPNDPRGSWSDEVHASHLKPFGPATKIVTRRSVAAKAHDGAARRAAKESLVYPEVRFTGKQALAISHGFTRALTEGRYTVFACAILPEHVHLVLAPHRRAVGKIVGHLKARATQAAIGEGLWHADRRPLWAEGSWHVFLSTVEEMRRTIRYVEQNPVKAGFKRQRWSFVTEYRMTGHGEQARRL